MEYLAEYGLFLAKTATFLVVLLLVVAIASNPALRRRGDRGQLVVRPLNDQIEKNRWVLQDASLNRTERKATVKARRKLEKRRQKRSGDDDRKRLFLIDFKGDLKASGVEPMREEITAILGLATERDEVVVRLESPGGMVHSYGLAASQLDRIRQQGVPLTVCVDKVAASGGYMMACVADRILAAPFAFIGSIGVVAQIPNFHRLLKSHNIDFEVLTAGEHKRTLTLFGENTEQGREKFLEELQETHDHFKDFVSGHRRDLDIDAVASGEVWQASRARELGLVDDLVTSDEYITSQLETAQIFEVSYEFRKSLHEKVGLAAEERADSLLLRWWRRLSDPRLFS